MRRTACILSLLLAACGSSPLTPSTPCGRLAQARCDRRSRCSNGKGIINDYGDMSTCLDRQTLACMLSLAAPMTGFSATAADACAAAINAESCSDFLNNVTPPACNYVGPFANGHSCAYGAQCTSSHCSGVRTALCGACADSPIAGASCATSNCGDDMTCVASTMTCVAFATVGEPCDSTHPCGADLNCVGETASTGGQCTATTPTEGASCGGTMHCDNTMGLLCANKMCTEIPYVAGGMPCGWRSDGSYGARCAGGACYTSTGPILFGQGGTCKAHAADGAACDTLLGPACLTPARCVTTDGTAGTCQLPQSACM
jgi:hypothetical protein